MQQDFVGRFTVRDDPPWPEGHAIERFAWHGFLHPPTGLGMVVDLATVDYFKERGPNEEEWGEQEDSFWGGSLPGWGNYHRCSLGGSWLVARPTGRMLRLSELHEQPFFVDMASEPSSTFVRELVADSYPLGLNHQDPGTCGNVDDDNSFGMYLLGHDRPHSHRLRFRPLAGHTWALDWDGSVDLTYYWRGTTTFAVSAQGFTFNGFDVPTNLSDDEAWAFFRSTCVEANDFSLVEVERSGWEREHFDKRFEHQPRR